MQIGILQCGHFPTADGFRDRTYTDLYSTLLAGRGLTFRTWSVVDMEFPESVRAADGWLLSGSRFGAYEDQPFIPVLEDFIREAYKASVPMVGICFGHQIMAQALGGKVEKFAGGWSVGRVEYDFDGETLAMNAWHQDQVVEAPEDARVISSTDFCKYAGLAYGKRALSIQPHPEFDEDDVRLLLDARAPGVVPGQLIENARKALTLPIHQAQIADRIANFFKEARHG